ncbi:MAG: signal peptide peptidase SppA [Deltaproteobacteria bacterium]|nr:signal peptide peptidase SppA [Deltaproteobacteria bacterium]
MAARHPIARGIAVLCTVVVLVFLAAFVLTYGTEGRLSSALAIGGRVGVVEVTGVIATSDDVVEALRSFEHAPSVKAVVVRVDSPGGGVAASQEIYHAIRELRAKKPVVASLGGVAASGGYYVASACDAIVANPGSLTGSIGVIMEMGNVQELLQKIGVQAEVLKAGTYKDMGSPVRPLTDDERAIFQHMIDSVHTQFITAVADGRKMDEAKVRALADGRIYSGEQAHELGLVDSLGGFQDAIATAAERGGIVGEPNVSHASLGHEPWWWRLLFSFAPAGLFPIRPALGLQLLYGGPFPR